MDVRKILFKYRYLIVVLIAIYIVAFIPLPYIIYEPGSAETIAPMVKIEEPESGENGTIMLTTVMVTPANMLKYIQAKIYPGIDIYKKEQIYQKGETRKEYLNRQSFVMLNSQSNATVAAYKHIGIPFEIQGAGVMVLYVYPEFSADAYLKSGDLIKSINGQQVTELTHIYDVVQSSEIGDMVKVVYVRNNKEYNAELILGNLADIDQQSKEPRPGLGVSLAQIQDIVPNNPSDRVTIAAGDIGGPSAGLMFSLQIIDKLLPEDITKGYRIAGTGEISADGKVLPIGGVRHKIVAADREKAEIFFTPEANAEEAKAKAAQIGTSMQVVIVHTLEEAMEYLQELPSK